METYTILWYYHTFYSIFAYQKSNNLRTKFKHFLYIIFFGFCLSGYSQGKSIAPSAKISILTCGPGDELYSTFGHSAIRIWDPVSKTDYVYNYGTFDFNDPNFYLNFTKGKPLFKLNKEEFSRFLYEYQYFKRWVKEQVLDLSYDQKLKLYNYLENNALPENRYYKYDYLYDNCATKIIEVLQSALGDDIVFKKDHLKEHYTFRELMRQKMQVNSWSAFGIDLALGSKIDKKATSLQHTFIPDYVQAQIENSTINGKPLVISNREILKQSKRVASINFLGTPLFWSCFFLLLVVFITFCDQKNAFWSKWLDSILFSMTGISGIVLLLLWFATDHTASAYNYNLLWVFPLNIVMLFFLFSKKQRPDWVPKYFLFLLVLLILAFIVWIVGVQILNPVYIPIILGLGIRYFFLWNKYKTI